MKKISNKNPDAWQDTNLLNDKSLSIYSLRDERNIIVNLCQTFPKSSVDIIDTTLLFSVKTLQYLLFTAIGFT